MCGFVKSGENDIKSRDTVIRAGLADILPQFQENTRSQAYKKIHNVVYRTSGELTCQTTNWWYKHKDVDGKWMPDYSRPTFNARNLDAYESWREALRERRAVVLCHALGETKNKVHYLMDAKQIMFLGALYKEYPDGTVGTAVITRDPHPRFTQYHDKATPMFLPPTKEFLDLWLDPDIEQHDWIDQQLAEQKLYYDLHVTPVATFKDAKPKGETEFLARDSD